VRITTPISCKGRNFVNKVSKFNSVQGKLQKIPEEEWVQPSPQKSKQIATQVQPQTKLLAEYKRIHNTILKDRNEFLYKLQVLSEILIN